jgi:hypothetical protein
MRRRIRNPRYAPEFLEKRLSPSSLTGSLTTSAYVGTTSTTTDPTPSPSGNGDPVLTPPTIPTSGPHGPG